MALLVSDEVLKKIWAHGEEHYPHEGAGLLLGSEDGQRRVVDILPIENAREEESRHNRYLITAQNMLKGERKAEELGLDVVGIFHSHPDHPNLPSEYDRDWAMPWYSYIITSIQGGTVAGSRSWRLSDDRSHFIEEPITSISEEHQNWGNK
jgi:proteasome lid subunit RPN8/RPN11